MNQNDFIQQVIRIALFAGTPLLIKWGVDADNAAAIITGIATAGGTVAWWLWWNRKKS